MTFLRLRSLHFLIIACFFLYIPVFSQEPSESSPQSSEPEVAPDKPSGETHASGRSSKIGDFETHFFGTGYYEFGQFVKGQYAHAQYPKGRLDHYWSQMALVRLGISLKRDDGLNLILAGEGSLYFPYTLPSDGSGFGFELLGPRTKYWLKQAEGSYSFGNPEAPFLFVRAGFFPFKYNPDARNFGDYLLRINSYPQFLPTHFDYAFTHLLGFHIGSTLFTSLKQDLLLTSEVYLWPLRDFSLSYLVGYNFMEFADVGAGVMGHRIFSVDGDITTPPPEIQFPAGGKFTFTSWKLMARLAFDFKKFLPFKDLLGPDEARLYGEACLNGLQNYGVTDTNNPNYPGYNDLMKRLPIAIGFNFPTFQFFDVLSLEGEWWNNDFANSYWAPYPTSGGYSQNANPMKYEKMLSQGYRIDPYGGPWHWSVYAKKTVIKNVALKFQAARDHSLLETSLTGGTNGDPEEAVDGLGNWMWMGKIEYNF